MAFYATERQLDELFGLDAKLVALSAEADYAASRRGLEFVTIEDLYDEDELLAHGERTFAELGGLAESLDARGYAFQLKGLLDAIVHRGLTALRALERLAPEQVVIFEAPEAPPDDQLRFADGLLALRAVRLAAATRGIPITVLPAVEATAVPIEPQAQGLRASVGGLVRWAREVRPRRGPASGLTLLVTTLSPDRKVVDAWVAAGGRVVEASTLNVAEAGPAGSWDPPAVVRAPFRTGGVDFFPLAETRLRHLVLSMKPRHAASVEAAHALLRRLQRPVVAGTVPVAVRDVALFEAARAARVPTAVHQHGGFLGYPSLPIARHHEFAFSEVYLCYGEGVARRVRAESDAEAVPVGSAALDVLRERPEPTPGTVVYAPSMLMGDSRYFSRHIYPDIWYARLQRAVVDRCAGLSKLPVVVKLPPGGEAHNPLREWIERRSFANVTIASEAELVDVLADAALVVLDSPATTLLQALALRVPVVAYADARWMTFDDGAVAQLREAASFATDEASFFELLERALRETRRARGTSFLESYGTFRDDGRSAARAVDVLATLARGASSADRRTA